MNTDDIVRLARGMGWEQGMLSKMYECLYHEPVFDPINNANDTDKVIAWLNGRDWSVYTKREDNGVIGITIWHKNAPMKSWSGHSRGEGVVTLALKVLDNE